MRASTATPTAKNTTTSASRLVLASCLAAAGAIHLAMVPPHWAESPVLGASFAICGWLQIALAAFVLARPSRRLLLGAIGLSVAAAGAWAVSRTVGLPFGHEPGHPEPVGFLDATCVALEGLVVIASAALAIRPRAKTYPARRSLAVAAIASLAVLTFSTAALATPSAHEHGAHEHGGHEDGHDHSHGDDKGFSLLHNGQHEHSTFMHTLDGPTQTTLDAQIALTREVAMRTPTVAAAEAVGYRRLGGFYPGMGVHYVQLKSLNARSLNADGVLDDADLRHPLELLFDGTDPTSRIVGLVYYSTAPFEPSGFAARNDSWHVHSGFCVKYTRDAIEVPHGLDNQTTPETCAALGGTMLDTPAYMVHVWSVPGYELADDQGGVFAELNPKLACADGTYYMLAADEWASHPLNVCKAQ